jgi:hypothetical protein
MRANSATVPVNIYASLAAYRLQHFFMTPVALGASNYNPCDNNEQNMTREKNTTAGIHSISEKNHGKNFIFKQNSKGRDENL